MDLTKISNKILHLKFESQESLAKTFLRFQEYAESPVFKGRPFTLGEYREWYIDRYGEFSYFTDWSGFNIPGHILTTFRNGLFDPLTEEEKSLLYLFKVLSDEELNSMYIIGTYEDGEEDVLDHEIAHGRYYTDLEYRANVNNLLSEYNLDEFKSILKDWGYHDDVIDDECHAYIKCNPDYLDNCRIPYPSELHEKLNKL